MKRKQFSQRALVDFLQDKGLSQRYACRLVGIHRSTLQYQPRPDKNAELRERLRAFSAQKRRRGSRKAWNWLLRNGFHASRNRVHRLWKQEGLQVKPRSGKKRRRPRDKGRLPLVALYPGHHPRERGYPVGRLYL